MERNATNHSKQRNRVMRLESLDSRLVMAAAPLEIYAVSVINEMRSDPVKFATDIDAMYRGTGTSAHGYGVDDPVWTDIRDTITNGVNPNNYPQALNLLSQSSPLPPLTWENSLGTKSAAHNAWMQTYCFAHSSPTAAQPSPCFAELPGISQNPSGALTNPDLINASTLGTFSSGAFNENIGNQTGPSMPATRAVYAVASDGHRQRQAYFDVMNFIVETNSANLSHLEGLLQDRRDAIGIDYVLLDQFNATPQRVNYLSTHTLSRNKDFGAYLTGLAYEDQNGNGFYDIGEQSTGCLTVQPVGSNDSTEYCETAGNFGMFSVFLPSGDYVVSGGGMSQNVSIGFISDNQNVDVTEIINSRVSTVSFEGASSSVAEDVGDHIIRVNFTPAPDSPVTIPVTVGGTATRGGDFTSPTTTSVTIGTGQTFVNIDLSIVNDNVYESSETLTFELGAIAGVLVGNVASHAVTIIDDDPLDIGGATVMKPEAVIGLHTIPGDGKRHLLMLKADAAATLTIQPSAGDNITSPRSAWILSSGRLDLTTTIGNNLRGTVQADQYYYIVFQATSTERSFDVTSNVSTDLIQRSQVNLIDSADVDGGGDISPRDALIVINFMATLQGDPDATTIEFVDVNQDNTVTPRDALQVINEIARRSSEREGELAARVSSDFLTSNKERHDQTDQLMTELGQLF